jgi:microcystin degradation protein MlrC
MTKYRIAVASFSHETLTFCPELTDLEAWEGSDIKYGPKTLNTQGEGKTYITGFKEATENHDDIELIGILRTGWPKTTGYGSWISLEAFDTILSRIISRLEELKIVDGVYLALHGAMAVKNIPRPEAEIVRQVRKVVGDVPIMVTFDLHANEDIEIVNAADAVFVLKTYPHLDSHDIGYKAGECMLMTLRGEFTPVMAFKKPKIVSASIFQASEFPPMQTIYNRCREWESKGVYCASIAPGFAYADVPDLGASIFVVTNNDQELAEKCAQDLNDLMWSLRNELTKKLPGAKDGVAEVMKMVEAGKKPVVIAYHDDRLGDGTHVLRELLDQGASNWCSTSIADPEVLKALVINNKVGDLVDLQIGGWLHKISGDQVFIKGKIEYLGELEWIETGPMGEGAIRKLDMVACLGLGDNRHVIITERLFAPMSSDPLKGIGLDMNSLDIVVIKSRIHHKAYWDTWSAVDFPVDPPGLGPADLSKLEYKYLPWDIYPIGKKYSLTN